MRKITIWMNTFMALGVLCGAVGCAGNQEVVLKSGDLVKAYTTEIRDGVELYDASVKESIAQYKELIRRAAVTEFGKVPAAPGGDTPDQKAASLMKRIDVLVEQEGRRTQLKIVMLANLDGIDKTMTDLQKLTIYAASIDAQIKDWVKSQIVVQQAVKAAQTSTQGAK